jgi:hypothetical protein
MLGLLAMTSSAMAAEIVEVRVGRHAEFTRVVFELDRSAGYRIERADPTSDVVELVVSLEATSIPRSVKPPKSLIKGVSIEPSGPRSVARIRLARKGLKLKEMILTSPPRIVLDVLTDRKPVPVPVAKTSKPKVAEKTFEEVLAKLPSEPTPVPAPTRPTKVTPPKPVVKVAKPEPAPKPVVEIAEPTREPTPEPMLANVVDEASEPMDGSQPSTSVPVEESDLAEDAVAAELASMESAPQPEPEAARKPRPMVVKSKPASDEGSGMTYAMAAVGFIALLVGGFFVARRFRGSDEVDFGEGAVGADDPTLMGSEENPFGNLSEDGPQMTLGSAGADGGDSAMASLLNEEDKESESVVFSDSEGKTMDEMEVISREQVNDSLGEMPSMGGVPQEFQQMMREMNRRVESLEGRIDELVDARDRLERQVAAQTEELRVQRAAIARTQRAVRNLARPEDGDGGEQEATEPALREPS